ncbi:MAG: KpsF/GutQ family sugar-phosphate isomerase [Pirellulaceae bacterium]|nr:KpsF/GutQ family sugar-phosphate isomerase [Pirellulales bacterium]
MSSEVIRIGQSKQRIGPFEQLRLAREIISTEAAALEQLANHIPPGFVDAVEAIEHCQGNLIVIGMGKAGLIGQKLVATFASTGTPSHFLHPAEAVHGDLGRVQPNDVVMLLSYSGETEEITRLLSFLTKLQVTRIAITSNASSTLATQSEIVLSLGTLNEAGTLGLAPSTSTTAMLALGDAIALTVSRQRQFTSLDFARFHPAGSLGKKLALVADCMRPLQQCRVAHQDNSIREVFTQSQLPGRRTGAVMLVDDQQQLTGLFTDSDLARLLEQNKEQCFDTPISAFMTQSPICLHATQRLSEAVDILATKRISELPVINEQRQPVGMIDITDTVALLPATDEDNQSTLPFHTDKA